MADAVTPPPAQSGAFDFNTFLGTVFNTAQSWAEKEINRERNGTQPDTTTSAPSGMESSWLQQNWMLVAGGALALVLVLVLVTKR
jgi:hypothetical protein